MDQRHQEYIDYYRVRVKKYENNPIYENSLKAEQNMLRIISGVPTLEEFKTAVEKDKPHIQCAIALVKDQELARQKHFTELNEPVRRLSADKILSVADSFTSDTELVQTVGNINNEVNVKISVDLLVEQFMSDITSLENIEVWETGDIPDEWHREVKQEWPDERRAEYRKLWKEITLPNARKWDPNWDLNYDLLWEERHRRKLSYMSDETLKKRIEQHKRYRGIL